MYRGLLFGVVTKYGGVWMALITTSVLFAASHVLGSADLGYLLSIFVTGAVYGGLRIWSGGVALPVTAHAMLNLAVVLSS